MARQSRPPPQRLRCANTVSAGRDSNVRQAVRQTTRQAQQGTRLRPGQITPRRACVPSMSVLAVWMLLVVCSDKTQLLVHPAPACRRRHDEAPSHHSSACRRAAHAAPQLVSIDARCQRRPRRHTQGAAHARHAASSAPDAARFVVLFCLCALSDACTQDGQRRRRQCKPCGQTHSTTKARARMQGGTMNAARAGAPRARRMQRRQRTHARSSCAWRIISGACARPHCAPASQITTQVRSPPSAAQQWLQHFSQIKSDPQEPHMMRTHDTRTRRLAAAL